MGDLPYAKYEDGKIWWRGTNADFSFCVPHDAIAIAREFERASEIAYGPKYEARCKAFAADLRKAIMEWEADNAE